MPMKKFINDPENLTAELLDGYVKAYSNKVALQSEKLVVRAQPKDASKVAIVTLGGSGHEPALSGFVGEGMLDISVVGEWPGFKCLSPKWMMNCCSYGMRPVTLPI